MGFSGFGVFWILAILSGICQIIVALVWMYIVFVKVYCKNRFNISRDVIMMNVVVKESSLKQENKETPSTLETTSNNGNDDNQMELSLTIKTKIYTSLSILFTTIYAPYLLGFNLYLRSHNIPTYEYV